MPPAVPRQVRVRVPATTANFGSGFDVFGLALQLYNVFTCSLTSSPGWRVSLPAGVRLPANEDNLVCRAARRLFTRVGSVPAGFHVELNMAIPLSRGLGSSSAAIVGGLVAANQLTGNTLSRDEVLAMAVDLEGHPDNVTPALTGGFTVSYGNAAQPHYIALPFPVALTLVVAIPNFELSTARARAVLPLQVSRADAIANCSRTALLIYALQQHRYDLLATAMEDRLHQPYRATLVPGMFEVMAAGYAAGALGMALSGAGPTVLAVTQGPGDAVAAALRDTFAHHGIPCTTLPLQADTVGAVCTIL